MTIKSTNKYMRKFLLFLVLIANNVFSQRLPDPVPPAPTAAALGKYGDVPVGMYTGVPQISIPLYELRGKNLQLPISLSYHSGGFRVEENASWVGLGWSLNAGGVITRTVKGIPDDQYGGYSTATFPPGDLSYNLYFNDVQRHIRDTEPDVFFYNFNGYSGKFVLDPNTTVGSTTKALLIPKSDLEIKYVGGHFEVKTPEGVKYTFSATETTQRTAYSVDLKNNPGVIRDTVMSSVSSWFMTTIKSPVGDETINLSYTDEHYKYESAKHGKSGYRSESVLNYKQVSYTLTEVFGKTLSDISYPAANLKVHLKADKQREDLLPIGALGSAKALEEIVVSSTNPDQILKKFVLNTDYFNSTSAYTDVGNLPVNQKYQWKRLKLVNVVEQSQSGINKPAYQLVYSNRTLPPKDAQNQDHWGYSNNWTDSMANYYSDHYMMPAFEGQIDHSGDLYWTECQGIVNSIPITGITYVDVPGVNREPNAEALTGCILKKIIYPTGGETQFDFEPNKYGFLNSEQYYEKQYEYNYYQTNVESYNNGQYPTSNENNVVTFTVEEDKLYNIVFDLENAVGSSGINFTNNEVFLTATSGSSTSTVLRLYYDWNPYYDPYRLIFIDEASQQTANLPLNISGTDYTIYNESGIPSNEGVSRTVIHGTRLVHLHPGVTYTLTSQRSYDSYSNCSNPGSAGCLINKNFVSIAFATPVRKEIPITENTIIETVGGGLRINLITDRPNNGLPEVKKKYSYRISDINGHDTNLSSGVILTKPTHFFNTLYMSELSQGSDVCPACGHVGVSTGCTRTTLQYYTVLNIDSDTPIPLGNTQGSNIGYREVKVSQVNNGFSVYKYTSAYDFPDMLPEKYKTITLLTANDFITVTENADPIFKSRIIPPVEAYDWKRGLLDSAANFNEQGQKLSGQRNLYNFVPGTVELRGINVFFSTAFNNTLTGERSWKNTDFTDTKITTGWAQLTKNVTSSDYDSEHLIKSIIYTYGSANHTKPTLETELSSDHKTSSKSIIYSADKPADTETTAATFNEMVDNKHILYTPIKSEENRNGHFIGGFVNNFRLDGTNVVPKNTSISKGGSYETRLEYDNYDSQGNLLAARKDETKIAYLWGYGGLHPVAKIDNADYASILSAIGGQTVVDNLLASVNPDATYIKNLMQTLRNALPDAQISTFTYSPSGVASITDAKGQTTSYEYDSFQRLKVVKDSKNEILKQVDYHHQGQ
jgi:YD repeat-containing protein